MDTLEINKPDKPDEPDKLGYTHLLLGLTRKEFARRVSLGQIDPQLLKVQLEQSARELRLESLCEKWIDQHSLEQVDKEIASE